MTDLFDYRFRAALDSSRPLAERMRPRNLAEFIGQQHLVGEGALIRRAVENDQIFSMILWGPPGCGKTTLARIIAGQTRSHFAHFSAVLAGIKDIRAVIDAARQQLSLHRRKTILFVDEIHRFNKAQQDAFLHHVENGLITLIGATTENPSFEVIAPLLSRCRVLTMNTLSEADIGTILARALSDKERGLGKLSVELAPEALLHLSAIADGDGRTALNGLEVVAAFVNATQEHDARAGPRRICLPEVEAALQKKALLYDKSGEEHYNLISALHKSLRGSDPDAALYWLGRMLLAGEDPLYIARRLVRFASEDIGNADPRALGVTIDVVAAVKLIGRPEGDLALAQAAVYLATAPKSNSLYAAYQAVTDDIAATGSQPVPFQIRNAPTRLMKDLGYGKGYRYAHDYAEAYAPQEYLPNALKGRQYYRPTDRGYEKIIKERLDHWQRLKKTEKS
jgi:putative ATPase